MILIVDDSDSDVELIELALESAGLEIELVRARDGVEALEYFARLDALRPHFVMLDLKMPRLDGFETLARMRGEESTRFIPVVVASSSAEPADVSLAYARGANSYVQKPVDFDSLTDTFGRLVRYWHDDSVSPVWVG